MQYDVYIERAVDPLSRGRSELAAIIAQRFHVSESKTKVFLSMGRVKARGNVDKETAQALAAQLEGLGAVVAIVECADAPPPSVVKATIHGVPPAPPLLTQGKHYESALSAAYEPSLPAPHQHSALGSLEETQAPLTLAKLDGDEPTPPPVYIPETERLTRRHVTDVFAPKVHEEPLTLALAAPPPKPRTPVSGFPTPTVDDITAHAERARVEHERAEENKRRILIGGALAVALGFVPAHFYASNAEDKYDQIQRESALDSTPTNEREYQLAVELWEITVDRLQRTHGRVKFTSGIVWVLAGSLIAVSWFKWIRPKQPSLPPRVS